MGPLLVFAREVGCEQPAEDSAGRCMLAIRGSRHICGRGRFWSRQGKRARRCVQKPTVKLLLEPGQDAVTRPSEVQRDPPRKLDRHNGNKLGPAENAPSAFKLLATVSWPPLIGPLMAITAR